MALPKHIMTSVEEYLKLDEDSYEARYEYIDGDIIDTRMLAGGTNNHSKIAGNITTILNNLLSERTCSVYTSDARVQLSASRYVYPDITVSCDEREQGDDKTLLYPRLIVEVLSPGTERGNKLRYYRECPTIQEYMLVDTQQPFIEVFKREENNFWTYHTFEAGDIVELACLDVRFPISEVYRKVNFPDTRPAGSPDQRDI